MSRCLQVPHGLAAALAAALALAGCNTPSPDFRGAPVTRVAVDGSVFDVRVAGSRAEAIRVNPQWAPRRSSVAPQAIAAMERASSCRVVRDSLAGDQAMMIAALDCGAGAPPPREAAPEIDCRIAGSYRIERTGQTVTEWDCTLF